MARGLAGGLIALTTFTNIAITGSTELKNAARFANMTFYGFWGSFALHRNCVPGSENIGPKVDLAISALLLGAFGLVGTN